MSASGPVTEPLPNLWAAGLPAYAFGVRTDMGTKPMRYLVARRFAGEPATVADTWLFVLEPAVLAGTWVHLTEDTGARTCAVHTYLPTMKQPLRIADRLLFDCLPLTDVGYVDLMAWRPPALRPAVADDVPREAAAPGRSFRFDAEPGQPPLWVREEADERLGVVIRRSFRRDGAEVRHWEVTEPGEPSNETLARRIRVRRPRTGHETEFVRSTAAVALPAAGFDAGPEALRASVAEALDEPAPTVRS